MVNLECSVMAQLFHAHKQRSSNLNIKLFVGTYDGLQYSQI